MSQREDKLGKSFHRFLLTAPKRTNNFFVLMLVLRETWGSIMVNTYRYISLHSVTYRNISI